MNATENVAGSVPSTSLTTAALASSCLTCTLNRSELQILDAQSTYKGCREQNPLESQWQEGCKKDIWNSWIQKGCFSQAKEIMRNQSRLRKTSVFSTDMMKKYHNTLIILKHIPPLNIDFQAVCGCILEWRSRSRKFRLGVCFAGLFWGMFRGSVLPKWNFPALFEVVKKNTNLYSIRGPKKW